MPSFTVFVFLNFINLILRHTQTRKGDNSKKKIANKYEGNDCDPEKQIVNPELAVFNLYQLVIIDSTTAGTSAFHSILIRSKHFWNAPTPQYETSGRGSQKQNINHDAYSTLVPYLLDVYCSVDTAVDTKGN